MFSESARHRLKFSISLLFAIGGIVSCFSSKPGRYNITTSKSYEASLFRQNCAICHGPEGEGKILDDGRVTPNIREGEHKYTTREAIYNHIADGGNGMVPFRDQLTRREIDLLVDLVLHELRQKNLNHR